MELLLGQVRHQLTLWGGALVSSGMISESDFQMALGAFATLAGIAWSAWRNWKGRAV